MDVITAQFAPGGNLRLSRIIPAQPDGDNLPPDNGDPAVNSAHDRRCTKARETKEERVEDDVSDHLFGPGGLLRFSRIMPPTESPSSADPPTQNVGGIQIDGLLVPGQGLEPDPEESWDVRLNRFKEAAARQGNGANGRVDSEAAQLLPRKPHAQSPLKSSLKKSTETQAPGMTTRGCSNASGGGQSLRVGAGNVSRLAAVFDQTHDKVVCLSLPPSLPPSLLPTLSCSLFLSLALSFSLWVPPPPHVHTYKTHT